MSSTLEAVAAASAVVLSLWGVFVLVLVSFAIRSGRARCSEGDAIVARAEANAINLRGGAHV